jgi:cytoskeletal protein RodZ
VLIGWRAVLAGDLPKRGALGLGCAAVALIGLINLLVGCTTITNGTATPDTKVAPAYRQSVSASVSASAATSSIRESQRQQSLTTRAVRTSCDSLATSSKDAIDKVNAFVEAYNAGRNTGPTEGPAIDALNNSASTVTNSVNDALSQQLKDAFNAYVDAAHGVADAIGTHASTSEFNRRVDQLNDTKTKALKLCVSSF